LSESLDWLKQDLFAIKDGWIFEYVIDYHELHRYLHPATDEFRDDREKFCLGQLVLNYLFNVSAKKLLLLPAYVEEFKARLGKIRFDFDALQRNETRALTSRQRELAKFIEKLSKGVIPETGRDLLRIYALDVLIEGYVKTGLQRALDRFHELVMSGKICFVEQIRDFDPLFEIDEASSEFQAIWIEFVKCRPQLDRQQPNITDTSAAYWVKKANELNFNKKKAFVLLSSSPGVRKAFISVGLPLKVGETTCESTILRDLYYILFQYYFCRDNSSAEEIIKNINTAQDLFKEYIKRMEGLRSKAVDITISEIDQANILPLYRQVLDSIWVFETCMVEATKFEPAERLPDKEVLDKIAEIAQDHEILRKCVSYALDALKSSIQRIDDIYKEIIERSRKALNEKDSRDEQGGT
jgi:hypothetical protein